MYQKYGSWILTGPGKDSLMKKRTVSWIMTAALGVGALTGSMCSANLVFAEEQTEELMQGISASMGVILTVPFTSLAGAFFISGKVLKK